MTVSFTARLSQTGGGQTCSIFGDFGAIQVKLSRFAKLWDENDRS
jgi:hypothetical protein